MPKAKKISFEEALQKLEASAEALRSGDLPLEKAVEIYNESLQYYNQCNEILKTTKQKIEMINPESGEVICFEEK